MTEKTIWEAAGEKAKELAAEAEKGMNVIGEELKKGFAEAKDQLKEAEKKIVEDLAPEAETEPVPEETKADCGCCAEPKEKGECCAEAEDKTECCAEAEEKTECCAEPEEKAECCAEAEEKAECCAEPEEKCGCCEETEAGNTAEDVTRSVPQDDAADGDEAAEADEETRRKEAEKIVARAKELVKKGNIARIVISRNGTNIVNLPLTAGLIGGFIGLATAPWALLIAAITTIGFDCKVELIKTDGTSVDISAKTKDIGRKLKK